MQPAFPFCLGKKPSEICEPTAKRRSAGHAAHVVFPDRSGQNHFETQLPFHGLAAWLRGQKAATSHEVSTGRLKKDLERSGFLEPLRFSYMQVLDDTSVFSMPRCRC